MKIFGLTSMTRSKKKRRLGTGTKGTEEMITKTDTYFMGYRLMIDRGVILKPKWYDLPRRLGFRKLVKQYTVPKGSVILGNDLGFMTVRDEDYHDLVNNPDFPRPEPRDNKSEGAARMGIDTIRNVQ